MNPNSHSLFEPLNKPKIIIKTEINKHKTKRPLNSGVLKKENNSKLLKLLRKPLSLGVSFK